MAFDFNNIIEDNNSQITNEFLFDNFKKQLNINLINTVTLNANTNILNINKFGNFSELLQFDIINGIYYLNTTNQINVHHNKEFIRSNHFQDYGLLLLLKPTIGVFDFNILEYYIDIINKINIITDSDIQSIHINFEQKKFLNINNINIKQQVISLIQSYKKLREKQSFLYNIIFVKELCLDILTYFYLNSYLTTSEMEDFYKNEVRDTINKCIEASYFLNVLIINLIKDPSEKFINEFSDILKENGF